jgi:hypothetical protein
VEDTPTAEASKTEQPSAEVIEEPTEDPSKSDAPSAEDQTDTNDEKKAE